MKLLYHKENVCDWKNPRRKIKTDSFGVFVLQKEPFTKTIPVSSNSRAYKKISFPYLIFILSYSSYKEKGFKKYFHHGCYEGGMRVFFAEKPLTSMQSEVCPAWTDIENKGLICTPHEYDYDLSFDSLFDLGENYLNVYFSLRHYIENNWDKGNPFDKIFSTHRARYYSNTFDYHYQETFHTRLRKDESFNKIPLIENLNLDKKWDRNCFNNEAVASILAMQDFIRK